MKETINCRLAIFALVAMLFTMSCKKGDSGTTGKNSPAKLLTSATWKESKIEWQSTDGVWSTHEMDGLDKASTITFFENNTFSSFDGEYTGTGTWKLSGDNTQITVYNTNGASGTISVSVLTSTTLQMALPLNEESFTGGVYTRYNAERLTYTH